MANKQLSDVLQTEVSRKESIGIFGLTILSILEFGRVLELFTGKSPREHVSTQQGNHNNGVYSGSQD